MTFHAITLQYNFQAVLTTKAGRTGSQKITFMSTLLSEFGTEAKSGNVVGVMYLDNRLLSTAFKQEDLKLLDYFAGQAAIALDNAQAYEEIKILSEKLKQENRYYEEQQYVDVLSDEIIGTSSAIKKVVVGISHVAESDATVLILGETGVGKELVAKTIHYQSKRKDKQLIRVHSSALPESLISSELFGHEKGSFTGAVQQRIGRFELADGGTLFLDEIGELPLEVQVKLLRVLQTGEFERVGGNRTLKSDFRLIVATNRDLAEEVRRKTFRKDLYYRLNIFPIEVPALRSRKDDIPLLVNHFLKMHCEKQSKPVFRITQRIINRLINYDWPGNVRELENVMERGVLLSRGKDFRLPELDTSRLEPLESDSIPTIDENERALIRRALKATGGKINGKGGAAELLNINRNTLYYRMKKLGIKKSKPII